MFRVSRSSPRCAPRPCPGNLGFSAVLCRRDHPRARARPALGRRAHLRPAAEPRLLRAAPRRALAGAQRVRLRADPLRGLRGRAARAAVLLRRAASWPSSRGITDPVFVSRNERPFDPHAEGEDHSPAPPAGGAGVHAQGGRPLRPFMREVIKELVDDVASRGRCDLVGDICEPYPIPIICELLGAPKTGLEELQRLGDGSSARLQRQPGRGRAADHHRPRTSWTSTSAG